MERGSDAHNARIDEELRHEIESLTHGAPLESRVEESRLHEDSSDDDPPVEPIIARADDAPIASGLTHAAVRERSDLARHLRGSVFPCDQLDVVKCAMEEHAPPALIAALETLPAGQYLNIEGVWEALGGERERRSPLDGPDPQPRAVPAVEHGSQAAPLPVQYFEFRFDTVHRLAAAPFLVSPGTSVVIVDRHRQVFTARFGAWQVETPLNNLASTEATGPYAPFKTIGPPHLSLSDRGLTFATNHEHGLCIRFHTPVRGIDPLGIIRHPGLTVTVNDVAGLRDALQTQKMGS